MLAKPHFRFKQFSVWHDQCAMKVSTDGILLGAWASISNETKQVLDIGTGTGLLSLMISQRLQEQHSNQTNPNNKTPTSVEQQERLQSDIIATDISITAVELDQLAASQASFNFIQSPWAKKLNIINDDIRSWNEQASDKYDLIVCNPPYFSGSLIGDDNARNKARHNDSLPFRDLLAVAKDRLNDNGTFELILPCHEALTFLKIAEGFAFKTLALTYVKTTPNKEPSRTLIKLGLINSAQEESGSSSKNSNNSKSSTSSMMTEEQVDEVIVRDENGGYTAKFTNLCRAFYLKMSD